MKTYILGIESSCDDTSAAVLENSKILASVISSQEVHRKFGGVVPELASRAHQKNIIPVIDTALHTAGISKKQLHAVAFTRGPGLLGSLLVGVTFAKTFARGLGIPFIETDHLQAHILVHFIEGGNLAGSSPGFPFLCLTVSGGHTQIVLVKSFDDMEIIGRTLDDAAGEAFDKTAKILGLPYPGGPVIDRLAVLGNPEAFSFPEPVVPGLDYSFSGLKTSILYFIRDRLKEDPGFIGKNQADLSASIQHIIVRILLKKVEKAALQTGIREVALAGGVAANSLLRKAVSEKGLKLGWKVYLPAVSYCTDNAAMVAITGYHKYLKQEFAGGEATPYARSNW
jgi:N6-L-threonylcarbamoyladenine synthase